MVTLSPQSGSFGVSADSFRSKRRDSLPEHTSYADSGCDIHHSCLTCPLERCRYDAPGGARSLRGEERDRQIISRWRSEGVSITALARDFEVSRRTVFRILSRARSESGALSGFSSD